MVRKRNPASKAPKDPLAYIHADLRHLALPLDTLVLDPKNARSHSNANIQAIARSLKEYGQVKPIVVNCKPDAAGEQTLVIEAGNGTYLAAQSLRWTHIAALKVVHDPKAQRGFSLADNRTAELATWNDLVLAELLTDVQGESPDLYEELLLNELSAAVMAEKPAADPKPAPPPEKMNTYQIVVQCTDAGDRRRLLRSLREQGRRCRALTWEGQVEMPGAAEEEPESAETGTDTVTEGTSQ
jgi:hypothetical protein